MSDGGKGSTPRPFSVSQAEYESRWDAIFGRDLKTTDCAVCSGTGQVARAITDTVSVESLEYAVRDCPQCNNKS